MKENVLNIDSVQLQPAQAPEPYKACFGSIANRLNASKLGYRITVLPAGGKAWPMHSHLNNEEMFFILEGEGTYRLGNHEFKIRKGDVIAAPAGGEECAHQIVNDSQAELRYLCVSTMNEPDVTLYPESQKFGVVAGAAPGGPKDARTFSHLGRVTNAVDYWDGEVG